MKLYALSVLLVTSHIGELLKLASIILHVTQFSSMDPGLLSEGASYNDVINCEAFPEVVNFTNAQLQEEANR